MLNPQLACYGWLTDSFDDALLGTVLLGAGVLVGYGAKPAGGGAHRATG